MWFNKRPLSNNETLTYEEQELMNMGSSEVNKLRRIS